MGGSQLVLLLLIQLLSIMRVVLEVDVARALLRHPIVAQLEAGRLEAPSNVLEIAVRIVLCLLGWVVDLVGSHHGTALFAHDEVCFSDVLAGACLLLTLRGKLPEVGIMIGHKRGRVTSIVKIVSSHAFLSFLLLNQLIFRNHTFLVLILSLVRCAVLLRMAAEINVSSSLLVDCLLVQIRQSESIGRSLVVGLGRGHVVLSCVAQDELCTSHGVRVVSGLFPLHAIGQPKLLALRVRVMVLTPVLT